MASNYELLRQRNIENNRKVLAELGLLNVRNTLFKGCIKEKPKYVKPKVTKKVIVSSVVKDGQLESINDVDVPELTPSPWRRSTRLIKKIKPDYSEKFEELKHEEEENSAPRLIFPKNRENVFGAIPGVEIGVWYNTRLECSYVGIHRPTVAGIHGNEAEGCYSLALSGGYEDDIDMGYAFTYTGEGGRDLKGTKANPKNLRTAPQSKDQTLTRGNLALSRNVENRRPVRVIRGYKLQSPYAPETGYRYDGLYYVEKYWLAEGLSGYMVYKFALKRCENQPQPAWEVEDGKE